MRFKIDSFYLDDSYGVIKFKGQKHDKLLFDRYEKGFVKSGRYSGWLPSGNTVNIDPGFQYERAKLGKVRAILPPE